MSKLTAVADATSTNADSRIGFQTEGGGKWPVWDRFITLDGKKAHHIGNICGTCPFIFERKEGANDKVSCPELSERLRHGVSNVDEAITRAAMAALPTGLYKAMSLSCTPRLIVPSKKGDYFFEEQIELWGIDPFWGVPHYTKNEYYRVDPVKMMADRGGLFEFIVPMFPKRYLDDKTIQSYQTLLDGHTIPTALAVSILDVKQPANWNSDPKVTEHWCLAHYLLDGHHKTYAASQANKPILLLSFLAVEKGVSTIDQVADVLAMLAKA
jgi:hypothetical protein